MIRYTCFLYLFLVLLIVSILCKFGVVNFFYVIAYNIELVVIAAEDNPSLNEYTFF